MRAVPEIITRAEARARGLKRYFTALPCRHGHVCERYAVGNGCTECLRIKNAKFDQNYPSKKKALQKAYYRRNRENLLKKKRQYREIHPEISKEWRSRNPGYHQQWQANHPEKIRMYKNKHRDKRLKQSRDRAEKVRDLIAVLHAEMPELLKEFGL